MRLADSPSWHLNFDLSEEAHVALYVRDTLELVSDYPVPALDPAVIVDPSPLAPSTRAMASVAWDSWWEEIVMTPAGEIPPHRPTLEAPLWDRVDMLAERGRQWFYAQSRPWRAPDRHGAWEENSEICRAAAEDAAFDLDVPIDSLVADVQMLLVRGRWWLCPAPGRLIYSAAIRREPMVLQGLLRDAFAAGVS